MDETLTERQREILDYLVRCNHSTRNIMRNIWHAVPGRSLILLEQRGYITAEASSAPLSTNVRYTITAEGRRAVGADA